MAFCALEMFHMYVHHQPIGVGVSELCDMQSTTTISRERKMAKMRKGIHTLKLCQSTGWSLYVCTHLYEYNLSETIFMDCCNFIAVMRLHRVYLYTSLYADYKVLYSLFPSISNFTGEGCEAMDIFGLVLNCTKTVINCSKTVIICSKIASKLF